MIDTDAIEKAVLEIIKALGEDPSREGMAATPRRVAEMYADLFSGIGRDPSEVLATGFEEEHEGMVLVKDIPFYSVCEHHLLPFFGVAHVGYTPTGRVVGASKVARALEILARRPQLQERLTDQVADAVYANVKPSGAGAVLSAEHMCMTLRGVKKPGSRIVTSATRGSFRTHADTRREFLDLVWQR